MPVSTTSLSLEPYGACKVCSVPMLMPDGFHSQIKTEGGAGQGCIIYTVEMTENKPGQNYKVEGNDRQYLRFELPKV